MAFAHLSISYTQKNIKSAYKNNKFKISTPTWNDEFDLPDGSYSVSNIQDYFEYNVKKHEAITKKCSCANVCKIRKRIVFKMKIGYKLELLSPETKKLLESTKKDIDKDRNGEDVPKLESFEVI